MDPYLFHFFHRKAVTHAHTQYSLIGHGRGEPLQVVKSPHICTHFNTGSYRGNKLTLNRGYPATCWAHSVGGLAV